MVDYLGYSIQEANLSFAAAAPPRLGGACFAIYINARAEGVTFVQHALHALRILMKKMFLNARIVAKLVVQAESQIEHKSFSDGAVINSDTTPLYF